MERSAFDKEVYDIVKAIPRGRVLTYGQIARLAGRPHYSRMVGQALGRVPVDENVPCHRVVNSNGRTAPGWHDQPRLLVSEGIALKKNGCVDLGIYHWEVVDF